jgi:O-antigen/teichoic acid export membrane protein
MSIKKLSTDFAFYGIIDVIQRSVSIILVPFYTRFLNQNDFGQLDMFLLLLSFAGVLIDFQFISGITRLYFEFISRDLGDRFAGTVIFFRVLIGLVLALVLSLFGFFGFLEFEFIPSFLGHKLCWILVLIFVPVSLSYDALMMQSRMLRAKVPFASGALLNSVFTTVGSVIATMILGWGITGIIATMLFGRLVGGLALFVGLRKNIKICIDLKILATLFNYCIPLIPGWWFGFSASYIGRFFIYGGLGAEESGLLAVSMKLQSLLGMFAISFRSAWQPFAMSFTQDNDGDAFYVRSMRLFLAIGFFLTFVFTIFIYPIVDFFAPKPYLAVGLTFAIFSVANIIGELESNLQLGCQLAKKTIWISMGSFISFIIVVFILYYYTDSLGIAAVGIALLLSSLARTILTYSSSQYFRFIPYDLKSFLVFGLGCLFLLFNVQMNQILDIPTLFWHSILLLVGLFLSFTMLRSSEIKAMISVIQSIKLKFRK